MDPVTAFGLAAGVVQFVQFSNKLLHSSVKIYKESGSSSSGAECLDGLCERLRGISSKLSTPQDRNSANISRNDIHLGDLAISCQKDCDMLLAKLMDLKTKSGHRRFWKSFREALSDGFGTSQNSFSQLQERLKNYESSMSLHMCAKLIESGETLHDEISNIRKEHKVHKQLAMTHNEKLGVIQKDISHILKEVHVLSEASHLNTDQGPQLEKVITQLEGLSAQNLDIRQSQQIIASLKFSGRPVRHGNIPEAHKETFEWALKPLSTQHAPEADDASYPKVGQGNILQWIRSGHGVFWVSGKPGSGKSTLMKFLADHRDVRLALASWAAPQPVYVAAHYFWSSGTNLQKSEQGLLQSILHQVLWQAPAITSDVCKQRWVDSLRTIGRDLDANEGTPWSVGELRDCLRQLAMKTASGIHLGIFVDGLDESEGDHLDMVSFLADLCRSPGFKICVSSRPWNVFEQKFGKSATSKIYMQELTRLDILNYTRSRFSEHPLWADTVRPDEGQLLVETITFRAQGVFLWVFLVTRLLREGLTNGDTFEDLQYMLKSVPPELEPFYKQILDSVPSVYHKKLSGFLQIALSYHGLDFRIYDYHEREYTDVDFAAKETVKLFDEGEYVRSRSRMIARFDAICKGFLELGADNVVGFLHRTVRDWSATEPIQQYLRQKARSDFNTTISVLRATLAWLKHPRRTGISFAWQPLVEPTSVFLSLAAEISHFNDQSSEHADAANSILDSLFLVAKDLAAQELVLTGDRTLNDPFLLLQGQLIVGGFWDYLDAKLRQEDAYFADLSRDPACVFALTSQRGLNSFEIQRTTCTSDREARARSRVIKAILSSVLRDLIPPYRRQTTPSPPSRRPTTPSSPFRRQTIPTKLKAALDSVLGYLIPPYTQQTSPRKVDKLETREIGSDKLETRDVGSAIKLIRFLSASLDNDPRILPIPTISSDSTHGEIQAWAGLFLLPFTESLSDQTDEYSKFLACLGSEILNGDNCRLVLLQLDADATIWDILCEEVRALSAQALGQQESPQERLVSHVIGALSTAWWELPGTKEKLRAAICAGFPSDASTRLIKLMDKNSQLGKASSHDGNTKQGDEFVVIDNNDSIVSLEQLGQRDERQVGDVFQVIEYAQNQQRRVHFA